MRDLAGIRERNALTYEVGPTNLFKSTVYSVTGDFICHCRSSEHAQVIALLLTDASHAAASDNRELFPEESSDEI